MENKKGQFITFEGIDGCGKSTQAALAAKHLESKGIKFVQTREPGGTVIAEKIRALILDPENSAMVDRCELLLFLAARAQHVSEKIIPLLEDGTWVLCDRFADATLAYQSGGRGMSLELLSPLLDFAASGLKPDRTFIFDIDMKTAAARMAASRKGADRMERNSEKFFGDVRAEYLRIAKAEPERVSLIDGSATLDEIAAVIAKQLDAM